MSLPNATQSWMRNYENPSYNPAVNRIADRQDSAQQFAGNFPSSNYQDTQMADWNTPPQIQIASTNDAPIDQTARNPFPFKAGSPEYVTASQQADATNNASVPVQFANFVQKHAPGIGGLLDDGGGIYGNSGNSDGGVRLAGFANNSGDNGSRAAIINSAIDAALGHTATPPAVTPPVASQGPIGPAYSIATAQGNYIVDSHGQYFMLDRTGAYMPVAPPRGAVA